MKANTWYNKGIPLYELGKYAEAIKCYDAAIRINPEHASAHGNKRALLARSKNIKNGKSNLLGRIKNILTGGNK